jgi:hypothetical protein
VEYDDVVPLYCNLLLQNMYCDVAICTRDIFVACGAPGGLFSWKDYLPVHPKGKVMLLEL